MYHYYYQPAKFSVARHGTRLIILVDVPLTLIKFRGNHILYTVVKVSLRAPQDSTHTLLHDSTAAVIYDRDSELYILVDELTQLPDSQVVDEIAT